DGVASLLDKSFLRQSEQEGEEPRFTMLETIREYGLECLAASGELEITRRAHAVYYLGLAEQAEPHLKRAEQARWFARLEQERDNLRAALTWLLEAATRGRGEERGKQQAERALRLGDAWSRGQCLTQLAQISTVQGEYVRARALLEESRGLYSTLGDQQRLGWTLYLLAHVLFLSQGGLVEAQALGEQSLALLREVND